MVFNIPASEIHKRDRSNIEKRQDGSAADSAQNANIRPVPFVSPHT